jgi:prepilin-type N-terminal cleavage/methylation domain-containing protein
MKRAEKGFTLIELLVVTAIVVLVANAAAFSTFQVLLNTESNRNQMTAVSQARNAGYWISLDAQRAQTVSAEGLGGGTEYITVRWEQSVSGALEEPPDQYADILYFAFSGDSGNSWSEWITAFAGDNPLPTSPFSYNIPIEYLTDSFRIRFYLNGPNGWIGDDEYAYLDNIAVFRAIYTEDCTDYDDWNNGNDWDIDSNQFRGHHDGYENDRYLTMTTSQDLSSYQGETVTLSWLQNLVGGIESTDGLYLALSSDNGSTWGGDIEVFHGTPPSSFNYTIPSQYLTNGFRMRLYLDDTQGGDEFLYLDDIVISVPIWSDGCSSFTNWDNGYDWDIYSGEFGGNHDGIEEDRYLTMNTSLDLTSQTYAAGFPLTFNWTTWSETGGTEYEVVYSITDGKLMRNYSVAGNSTTETYIAQYIDPYETSCQFIYDKLTFVITSTVGGGETATSETREFQVITRPD